MSISFGIESVFRFSMLVYTMDRQIGGTERKK